MANFTIIWVPSNNNTALSQNVQYKKSTQVNWTNFASVGKTISTSTITGLDDNTIYDFRVMSVCNYGGPTSSNSLSMLDFECPNITLTSTSNSISYSFVHPGKSISGFTVELFNSSNTTILATQIPTIASTITGTFSALNTSISYNVKVTLLSSAGLTSSCVLQYISCPIITITPTLPLQNYIVGIPINEITLGASGADGATYTYAVTSGVLPNGFSGPTVTLVNGVISGTPTLQTLIPGINTGINSFTITATSSIGGCTGTKVYNYITMCPTLVDNSEVVNENHTKYLTIGTFYNMNFGLTGNTQPLVYTAMDVLPAGLTLNTVTGFVSGIPTTLTIKANYDVSGRQLGSNCETGVRRTLFIIPAAGPTFGNVQFSQEFQTTTCAIISTGTYTVPANSYYAPTQLEADTLAQNDILAYGLMNVNFPPSTEGIGTVVGGCLSP